MPFITGREFDQLVFRAFGIKKPELNDIKAEIMKYNKQFQEMDDLQKYEQLKVIRSTTVNYINKYPNSGRNNVLREVILDRVEKEVINNLQPETAVPKKLHFVWVGGALPDVAKRYLSIWKIVNEDYTSTIWFDSRILLINTLKKAILERCYNNAVLSNQENVLAQIYTHHDFIKETAGPIYEERRKFIKLYQEQKEENSITNIIIQFLTSETYGYGKDAAELQESYDTSLAAMTELGAKDISETDLLTSNGLETLYFREVLNNQNLAAASDMVRMAALVSEGGYYLDVDLLPAVNKELFRSIPDPFRFSSAMWERIHLESIMKWKPDLIEGYTTGTYDILTGEIKEALQAVVESNEVKDLLLPLSDIMCHPLAMKFTADADSVGNNALVSHPNSALGRLMIQNMIHNYSILDDLYKNVTLDSSYTDAVMLADLAFGIRGAEMHGFSKEYDFLTKILNYINVGLQINADATMELTGPGNVLKSVYNFFLPAETEYSYPTADKLHLLWLSDGKVSIKTEEERASSWILRDRLAAERFLSVKKNLLEGALDYDDTLDFSDWSLPDFETLEEKILSNNWITTKPDHGRIIVQMQGDSISKEAASNLFVKYSNQAMLVVKNPDGIKTIYKDPESNQLVSEDGISFPSLLRDKKAITMTVVGHGGGTNYSRSFAEMTAVQLKDSLLPVLETVQFNDENVRTLSVNLLGCRMHHDDEPAGTSYPEQLLTQMYDNLPNQGTWDRSKFLISANQFDVRINQEGKKEILDYSGRWVVKEEVMLRDQLGKRYFRYNEQTETEKLTNEAAVLAKIIRDTYQTLVDPVTSVELKSDIMNGFLIGEKELKDALEWGAIPSEESQKSERLKQLIRGIELTEKISSDLYLVLKGKELTDSEANYYFDLESVRLEEETGFYHMRLFNLDTDEIITITDENPLFLQYKNLIYQQVQVFKDGVELLTDTHVARRINLSESQNASTMNAAFFLQSILEFRSQYNEIHNLDKTLRVQIYAQLFRNGVGTLQSAAEVSKLIADASGTQLKFLDGLSGGFSAAAVILDGVILTSLIIELKYTSDPRRRVQLETQIGIISTNVAMNVGSVGASMIGATTVAGVLAYLAIPVAGLLVGLPTLIDNLYVLRQGFLDSVRYFGHLYDVIVKYPYDEEKKASIPADDIVITEVDFKNKKYHLGDFYLYSMTSGWGHTPSEIDTFFTAPNPTPYGELISVYKAINFAPDHTFPDHDVVVLPGALNRRIDYEMSYEYSVDIPVDTDDQLLRYGIQVLNNIKFSYAGKFYWRYTALSQNFGITKLVPVYMPTEIKVIMDKKSRTLIIPHNTIPEARQNLKYIFTGGGGEYTVVAPPESVDIQFELVQGDVWTINVDYFIHQTAVDEAGTLVLKDEFIENMPQLKISTESDIKKISIGTGTLTWKEDLKQTVHLHLRIAGELVQMLLAVNLETDSITAVLSGKLEDIIANKTKIVTAIQTLNIKEVTDASIQFMSSHVVSGCVHVKEDNLIVAAASVEEDTKKVYTIYGDAEEQDSSKYLYVVEQERNVSVNIKEETIVITGDFAYEDETAEYVLTVDNAYDKSLRSLRLDVKAAGSMIAAISAAEDKRNAMVEWLSATAFAGYLSVYSISNLFTFSCTDKDGRYIEYMLTADTLKSYYGSFADSGAQYTIFNNGRSHLIISQNSKEDMYGNIVSGYYIKSNIVKDLFIDDIIILPGKNTYYTTIEPLEEAKSLPAIHIAALNRKDRSYVIEIKTGRENFVWSRVGNDLILYNNVDEPEQATVKLRFMDAFHGESVIRNTLRVAFMNPENGKINRYRLSSLLSTFRKAGYPE